MYLVIRVNTHTTQAVQEILFSHAIHWQHLSKNEYVATNSCSIIVNLITKTLSMESIDTRFCTDMLIFDSILDSNLNNLSKLLSSFSANIDLEILDI